MTRNYLKTLVFTLVSCLSGATINVPADYSTVQSGINASSNGDTVLVQSGLYYENIDFGGKDILLRGFGSQTTIIDGRDLGSVIKIESGEQNVVIFGFTIQNGNASLGGGISIKNNSSAVIQNCIIKDNHGRFSAALAFHGPTQRISIENALARKDILTEAAKQLADSLFNED